jgi:cyanate permease
VGSVQLAFDFRLFKRMEFLLLLGWGFFSMLGYIVLLFSLPNYARSIGLSAQQGSVIGALLNLGQGRISEAGETMDRVANSAPRYRKTFCWLFQ